MEKLDQSLAETVDKVNELMTKLEPQAQELMMSGVGYSRVEAITHFVASLVPVFAAFLFTCWARKDREEMDRVLVFHILVVMFILWVLAIAIFMATGLGSIKNIMYPEVKLFFDLIK